MALQSRPTSLNSLCIIFSVLVLGSAIFLPVAVNAGIPLKALNITVYDQGSNDLTLQYNDQITILVGFDKSFDDSNLACMPHLVLNVAEYSSSSSSSSSVTWVPRATIARAYGFEEHTTEIPDQLQSPPDNTLVFQYIVSKGDWAPTLDIGSRHVSKVSALSFSCPSITTDAPPLPPLEVDLSLFASMSIYPVYSVNSRIPFPIQVKSRQKSGTFQIGDQLDIIIE